jgi:hypothetical protein
MPSRLAFAGERWATCGKTIFAADVTLTTKDGKHFHTQKDVGKGGMSSRVRNREYNIRLTIALTNIPTGEYMADFMVRDAVSGKSGTFSLPFVIK